ncbi:Hypp5565 [Branchiostoma lanceolatum]|uniref:Hypp5565 protein n=1 Tax=Branchiostoma lanceolatum TaxID=7740 RepID=A0A8J9WFF9_BRALA|nr:Hypp5565 [Branchiostoma lanceolatum]
MRPLILFLALALPALAAAHSWIVCTDYLENNGWYWDEAKCRAWPRSAARHDMRFGKFGNSRGFTHRLDNHPEETALCKHPRNDDTEYTDFTPMAAYYLGQKVVLTHPTNNHVADVRCTNSTNVIDTENLIFVVDGDEDPCCIDSDKLIVVEDMGISPFGRNIDPVITTTYPKPGFQNAPKYCEDEGNAMGTYNFTIPMDMKPGRHTFVWKWIRSPRVNPFTTCWEADVFATKVQRDAHYAATGQTTVDLWDFYQINTIVDGEIVDPIDPVDQIISG